MESSEGLKESSWCNFLITIMCYKIYLKSTFCLSKKKAQNS